MQPNIQQLVVLTLDISAYQARNNITLIFTYLKKLQLFTGLSTKKNNLLTDFNIEDKLIASHRRKERWMLKLIGNKIQPIACSFLVFCTSFK